MDKVKEDLIRNFPESLEPLMSEMEKLFTVVNDVIVHTNMAGLGFEALAAASAGENSTQAA